MEIALSVKNSLPIIYRQTILLIIAGLIVVGDQLSKRYIEVSLALEKSWWPIPNLLFFRFTHVANTGGAFGLFPSQPSIFLFIVTAATIIIIYKNNAVPLGQWDKRVALGLILGGALGNAIDRFRLGHVVDFIDLIVWPVFNVADLSVVIGVFIYGWILLHESQESHKQ